VRWDDKANVRGIVDDLGCVISTWDDIHQHNEMGKSPTVLPGFHGRSCVPEVLHVPSSLDSTYPKLLHGRLAH